MTRLRQDRDGDVKHLLISTCSSCSAAAAVPRVKHFTQSMHGRGTLACAMHNAAHRKFGNAAYVCRRQRPYCCSRFILRCSACRKACCSSSCPPALLPSPFKPASPRCGATLPRACIGSPLPPPSPLQWRLARPGKAALRWQALGSADGLTSCLQSCQMMHCGTSASGAGTARTSVCCAHGSAWHVGLARTA